MTLPAVLQSGREADLSKEPLGAGQRAQLGMQHLQRDRPTVLEIMRQVNRPRSL